MTPDLAGRAVVITGSGRGLGRAYALHAAAAGARVLVNDVDAEPAERTMLAIRSLGGDAMCFIGSVADWEQAAALVATCVEAFGAMDGLVNNAGIFRGGAVGSESEQDIRDVISINLLGTLFCGHHASIQMRRQGRGSIVNISSAASIGGVTWGTYGASKAGVLTATKCWAKDLAEASVRVNAVLPAAVTRLVPAETGELPPETVSPLVTYLLSDRSRHVTGQAFRIRYGQISRVSGPYEHKPTRQAMPADVAGVSSYVESVLATHIR